MTPSAFNSSVQSGKRIFASFASFFSVRLKYDMNLEYMTRQDIQKKIDPITICMYIVFVKSSILYHIIYQGGQSKVVLHICGLNNIVVALLLVGECHSERDE